MSLKRSDDVDHRTWLRTKDLTPVEKGYLLVLVYLDRRLRVVDYLELLEDRYYKVNMQMSKSHTELPGVLGDVRLFDN